MYLTGYMRKATMYKAGGGGLFKPVLNFVATCKHGLLLVRQPCKHQCIPMQHRLPLAPHADQESFCTSDDKPWDNGRTGSALGHSWTVPTKSLKMQWPYRIGSLSDSTAASAYLCPDQIALEMTDKRQEANSWRAEPELLNKQYSAY